FSNNSIQDESPLTNLRSKFVPKVLFFDFSVLELATVSSSEKSQIKNLKSKITSSGPVYSVSSFLRRPGAASEQFQHDCRSKKHQEHSSLQIPSAACNAENQASLRQTTRSRQTFHCRGTRGLNEQPHQSPPLPPVRHLTKHNRR